MKSKTRKSGKVLPSAIISVAMVLLLGLVGYSIAFVDKIFPNIYVFNVNVGGLTRQEALAAIDKKFGPLNKFGLTVRANNTSYIISADRIDFPQNGGGYATVAWQIGRTHNPAKDLIDRLRLLFSSRNLPVGSLYDPQKLRTEIIEMAEAVNQPAKDIRLSIEGTEVFILTDTKKGKVINQARTAKIIGQAIQQLDFSPIPLPFEDQFPTVKLDNALAAKQQVLAIIAKELVLKGEQQEFSVSPEIIGTWITTKPREAELEVGLDKVKVSQYVESLSNALNIEPKSAILKVASAKVLDFRPPQEGRLLNQEKAVADIIRELQQRQRENLNSGVIDLEVKTVLPVIISSSARDLGIKELIGKATTPFAGSPAKRIANIKNGTKFLSGILIKPGEEFSTVGTLGKIDNTTGYLPELVIKGNRTVPEFGGGLCQVSTTLFRAALNAGLPITARQAHSYRVPYYEKDGDGNYIGPGLDATIYQPQPDLKFVNDTGNTILIWGYVKGSKVTFEIYGSKDRRKSEVIGPQKLSETPAGDPIYAESDTLSKGVTKQIETPHPGGTATATYRVTYSNGEVKEQIFKSSYRAWPARYLVGTGENNQIAKNPQ